MHYLAKTGCHGPQRNWLPLDFFGGNNCRCWTAICGKHGVDWMLLPTANGKKCQMQFGHERITPETSRKPARP